MPEAARQIGAPGLAWGVIVDGELAASGAVGVREAGGRSPVTPATVFRIASMSKSFTALAILALRDDGKLSLDDPVSRHIPEFAAVKLPTRDAPPITVRHLLTHAEGLPEDNPWGDRQLAVSDATLNAWLARGLPFSTSPGTAFEYSNYGFALLGRIVTNASGTPYDEFIRTRILVPLGMTATAWDGSDVASEHLAHGHRRENDGWSREVPLAHGSFGAMGGLYTSTADLARYVAFMLSAWPPRDDPDDGPVRRSSVREMQQGQRTTGLSVSRAAPDATVTASSRAYAFGLGETEDCRFRHLVAHGGGLPGFGSSMQWLPEHGVGVIVLANVTYAGAGGVARQMLDLLAASGGLAPRRWPASPALVETRAAIASLVNRWDAAAFEALAADNLLLDRPLERRRDEFDHARQTLGGCRPDGEIEAENWLRGRFRLGCDRGWLHVTFTLAPTMPPRVQYLTIVEGLPLSAALDAKVRTLTSAIGAAGARLDALLAPSLDRAAIARQLSALGNTHGRCTVAEVVSGDGAIAARIRLACDRGQVDAVVRAAGDGRLEGIQFLAPPGQTCVP
jgi:CubicO group peptidase (beta-lactamase class C family)